MKYFIIHKKKIEFTKINIISKQEGTCICYTCIVSVSDWTHSYMTVIRGQQNNALKIYH